MPSCGDTVVVVVVVLVVVVVVVVVVVLLMSVVVVVVAAMVLTGAVVPSVGLLAARRAMVPAWSPHQVALHPPWQLDFC